MITSLQLTPVLYWVPTNGVIHRIFFNISTSKLNIGCTLTLMVRLCVQIADVRLEKLLRLIQEVLCGRELENATKSLDQEYHVDPSEDLNKLSDAAIEKKKKVWCSSCASWYKINIPSQENINCQYYFILLRIIVLLHFYNQRAGDGCKISPNPNSTWWWRLQVR